LVHQVLELAEREARQALGELVDYGILLRQQSYYEVSHPLLHIYARQELLAQNDPAIRRNVLERVVRALDDRFPKVEFTTWAQCEALLPHVQACATLLEEQGLVLLKACLLLNRAGWYLRERARYTQSVVLLQLGLTCYEQLADETAPGLGSLLNNLAMLYRAQGKYAKAKPLYQRALAIYEQQVGPAHPYTATSLHNLASLYQAQGKYAEAEPLLQRALAICEQQLGASHPTTKIIRQNYTSLLQDFSPRNEKH
jgi:tetratricopeptide (TPR) repeat protein